MGLVARIVGLAVAGVLALSLSSAVVGNDSPCLPFLTVIGGENQEVVDLAAMRADHSLGPLLLADVSGVGDFSPDGRYVTVAGYLGEYHSDGVSGPTSIVRLSVGGGELVRLTNGFDDRVPSWSPDGQRIAFVRVSDPEVPGPGDASPQVAVVPAKGGPARSVGGLLGVTKGSYPSVTDLEWESPQVLLAVVQVSDVDQSSRTVLVVRFDLQTGTTDTVTQLPTDGYTDLVWSPDASRLAWTTLSVTDSGKEGAEVAVYDVASDQTRLITRTSTRSTRILYWRSSGDLMVALNGGRNSDRMIRVVDGSGVPHFSAVLPPTYAPATDNPACLP